MEWFDEVEEIEFEGVECTCNLKSNTRYLRLNNIGLLFVMIVSIFFIENYPLVAGILICAVLVLFILGALWYIFYSKQNHSIRFVLHRDSIVYIDENETEKRYHLNQLDSIKKKHVFGWGDCYQFCFDDSVVNVYDGDDLAGLMMGLRNLGKFGKK